MQNGSRHPSRDPPKEASNCKRFASPASPIVDLFVRNCAIFATDVFACQLSALLLKTLVEKMQCWGNSPPISSGLVGSVELYTTL